MSTRPLKPPRSLVILLQALVSERVKIETRSGAVLTGVVDAVDRRMNLTMSDAASTSATFPSLYIAGRQIVFVHLPDNFDVGKAIDDHVAKLHPRSRR
jgi:small nuclear ribonucleoprotein (snRNP)-like protein